MMKLPTRLSIKDSLAHNRIYLLLGLVFLMMTYLAPNFLARENLTLVLKGASLNAIVAIGFTIILICRQLDLSIGTSLTLGGMITIGLQPVLGWAGSILAGVVCGAMVGAANGLLVTKFKVDSFIATLGTMTITQGLIFMYCKGGTLTVQDFRLGDWLEQPLLPFITPRILAAIVLVLFFEGVLKLTRMGRGFFLVGGNPQTAWHAGLGVDRYIWGAFILSGALASFGGALFSISLNSAMPTMGNSSLMVVIAATIIGGTSMAGGRGSIVKSAVALITLAILFNGFSAMGAGSEVQKIASGLVLAAVILYDALQIASKKRMQGVRRELLEEIESEPISNNEDQRSLGMERKDSTIVFGITAMAFVACVAIVAIFAMYFVHMRGAGQASPVAVERAALIPAPAAKAATPEAKADAPSATPAIAAKVAEADISTLKSLDNQPLLLPITPKDIPARPANPDALAEDDPLHWYDMEYAGWGVKKLNLPKSPGDGPAGKKVIYLKFVDHPYLTAMSRGMQKVADFYGIQMKTMVADNDINKQSQQVDQAINEKPDLIIINPVDAKACVPLFRKMNQAGIPIIASNLLPVSEAQQYCLAWTGPDDWGQFRLLAQEFAKRMNYEGGYCIVRHFPGGSPFFSRTYGIVTELKKVAPKMKCLAMQTTDLNAEKTMQVVSDWITRYGAELKGIASADDSGAQIGINEAVKNAGREDIIRVAAGNSKVGMDFVKEGKLHAITYQSPEADGATPMELAAEWFSGKQIEPVRYLPMKIITKENVEQYMPAQW